MSINPKQQGDYHVKEVKQVIEDFLLSNHSVSHSDAACETAKFIISLYPNIQKVSSKFEEKNSSKTNDLIIDLDNNEKIRINLFLIKKSGKIQTKNLGAKSFLEKYFLSKNLQTRFNEHLEYHQNIFFEDILSFKKIERNSLNIRKRVSEIYEKFDVNLKLYRDKFLFNLRDSCFILLQELFNEKSGGFKNAYNAFFMSNELNIVASYDSQNNITVKRFEPRSPDFDNIQLYKNANDTVGIKYGNIALTLRFKFESSPTSSIKLAVSYCEFPEPKLINSDNRNTIQQVKRILQEHKSSEKNDNNAIGKCHEAYAYYYLLKEFDYVIQTTSSRCVEFLNKYSVQVTSNTLMNLYNSTATIIPELKKFLLDKYKVYTIENIELIPDAYINNPLNTSDLQLIIRANNQYFTESISLKAVSKKIAKITIKNPGIGTILGSQYFDIGSMQLNVEKVKEDFNLGRLDHKQSLKLISQELGSKLKMANQEHLKQGVENLLGNAIMIVTFYKETVSLLKEHSKIKSHIDVLINKPSYIQNTLEWNKGTESISLRVKFSKGKQHGWSSVKIASEYEVRK